MEKAEKLIGDLKSEDYSLRRYAAEELGRLQAKEAAPELLQLLGDPSWDVRKAAASALGSMGEKEAIPALLPLLKDPDWFVRETAAIALGKLGDDSAVPYLEECLNDEVYSVRKAASSALRKLGVDKVRQRPVSESKCREEAVDEEARPEKEESSGERIISVVREMGAALTTLDNGFDLEVGVGKGRHQKVQVRFEEDQIVYQTSCGPAAPDNYLWALRANCTIEYGSLAVVDVDSQPTFVVIERQLEETVDREEIRKAIWAVATFGDWVEESMTKEDKM